MIDQNDINMLLGVCAAGVSSLALFRSFSKDGTNAIEGLRRELEAKLATSAAENKAARHDAANVLQRRQDELSSNIRALEKDAMTKSEGTAMEHRLQQSLGELKRDMGHISEQQNKSREMLAKILAKVEGGDD